MPSPASPIACEYPPHRASQTVRWDDAVRSKADPDGSVELNDLNSTNGTAVNGQKVAGPVRLHGGERIGVGRTILMTEIAADRGSYTDGLTHVPVSAAPPPAQPRSQSAVRRLSQSMAMGVRRSQSTVIRQLTRTTRRAMAIAVLAVLAAVGIGVAAVLGAFSRSKPSVAEIARAVQPSTVFIDGQTGGKAAESGSGWILDASRGLIVTNGHVAEGAESLKVAVGVQNGAAVKRERAARIVGAAPCDDIALLSVADTSGLRQLKLGSQASMNAGDEVVALGFPENASQANRLNVTSGTVSDPRTSFKVPGSEEATLPDVIQTTATINPGNSGGPLVDTEKRLIGMNTATFTGPQAQPTANEFYAIGVDQMRKVAPQLQARHSIGSAGFIFAFGVASQNNLPGIVVRGAIPGTPAASALAQVRGPGASGPALLVAINGTQLADDKGSYCAAVQKEAGESGRVTLQTAGGAQTVATRFDSGAAG